MHEGIVLIYTTCGVGKDAADLARAMVNSGTVVCANIGAPHISIFQWQGKIQEGEEVSILMKTSEGLYQRAIEFLAGIHPYELPTIFWWGADATPETIAWIKNIQVEKGM